MPCHTGDFDTGRDALDRVPLVTWIFINKRCHTASNFYLDVAIFPRNRMPTRGGLARASRLCAAHVTPRRWRSMMLDAVFLALGLGFFAAGCLYLYACDRL
jgi:hypothetical protein